MSVMEPTITLTENDDGWWTARNLIIGVTAQGQTSEEALSNLTEVVDAIESEGGREPTEEELRKAGIDPEDNVSDGELPEFLR